MRINQSLDMILELLGSQNYMEKPILLVHHKISFISEMEALDTDETLTPLGYILAKLPIEPRFGKMIVLGCIFRLE